MVSWGTLAQDDVDTRALAENVVGHRHRRRVEHARVRQDQVLDLLSGDLLTAAVDEVFGAALDDLIATRTQADDVATPVVPIGCKGALVVLRRVVVAADGVRSAGQQLTQLTRSHVAALLIDDTDLVVRRARSP
jgi:hypothetical protein